MIEPLTLPDLFDTRLSDRFMAQLLSSDAPLDQPLFEANRVAFLAEFSRSERRVILKCVRTSKPIPGALHGRFMTMLAEQIELDREPS